MIQFGKIDVIIIDLPVSLLVTKSTPKIVEIMGIFKLNHKSKVK